jgi:hypothetical protein
VAVAGNDRPVFQPEVNRPDLGDLPRRAEAGQHGRADDEQPVLDGLLLGHLVVQ